MSLVNTTPKSKQRGAVLAVSLMILLVMTIVAISAMDGSTLGFKMSQNSVYHDRAFNNSESGRTVVAPLLKEYMFSLDWEDVDIPTSVTIAGTDASDPDTWVDLVKSNGSTEEQWNSASLTTDIIYSDATNDITANISVIRSGSTPNDGAGAAQYKGYHGAGVGTGGQGGSQNFFEFRSEGGGPKSAESWTAADFRYIP